MTYDYLQLLICSSYKMITAFMLHEMEFLVEICILSWWPISSV